MTVSFAIMFAFPVVGSVAFAAEPLMAVVPIIRGPHLWVSPAGALLYITFIASSLLLGLIRRTRHAWVPFSAILALSAIYSILNNNIPAVVFIRSGCYIVSHPKAVAAGFIAIACLPSFGLWLLIKKLKQADADKRQNKPSEAIQ